MGDQHRWFKLWVTAPADDALQELPPALRWAWAALGCYTKAHGTNGVVVLSPSNAVLAAEMGVPLDQLLVTVAMLPHVRITQRSSVNGNVTVTWQNWTKYQMDSTVAKRQQTSRSKKRGEIKKETTPKEQTPDQEGFSRNPIRTGRTPEGPQALGEILRGMRERHGE